MTITKRKALSDEEEDLLRLSDELYGGDWDEMNEDLQSRIDVRPYVHKLVTRIKLDLERIENLKKKHKEL